MSSLFCTYYKAHLLVGLIITTSLEGKTPDIPWWDKPLVKQFF